jgi:isocitrate/isopropylmalate dehydrogenase
VLASAMMLDFLGWKQEAQVLREAVKAALREDFVTPDLGGVKQTVEVGDWLANFSKMAANKT